MDFYVAIENAKNGSSETMTHDNARIQAAKGLCGDGNLPTEDELLTIFKNKSEINRLSTSLGGQSLINGYYWSSTAQGYTSGRYDYLAVNIASGHGHLWSDEDSNYYVRSVY